MCESIIAGTTKLATDKSDTHLFDFLETHFKQMKSILKMNDYIINLCKTGVQESGITVCTFDKHTLGDSDNKHEASGWLPTANGDDFPW